MEYENMIIECKYYEPGATEDFCAAVFDCAKIRSMYSEIECNYGFLHVTWTEYIKLKSLFEK